MNLNFFYTKIVWFDRLKDRMRKTHGGIDWEGEGSYDNLSKKEEGFEKEGSRVFYSMWSPLLAW